MTTSAGLPNWLKYSYFVVLAAVVPWAKPTLPMNSEVVDYVNVLFFFLLWVPLLVRRNLDVRLYVPLCLIFAGSLIAMLNSPALGTCVTTLLQESYLYLFFLTLCNVLEDERDVRVLVLAWLAAAVVVGFVTLSQFRGDPEFRARGTFDNPNMAASYLGISCFLVLKPISRFPWPAKLLFLAFTFGGMFATKSLSAMLACVLGLGGMALVYLTQGWPGTRGRIGILLFILILGLAG
ncbi:MAG TPA: hypothetical protein VFV36_04875, partial [Candidatus Methylomirabilis sp.]|nr:hypothetical protein [Candidatus Methylomirabilis sp.]